MAFSLGRYQGGLSNKGVFDLLSQTLDFQNKNQFETLIINSSSSLLGAIGGSVVDSIMARVFLYNVTFPMYGFDYIRNEGNVFVGAPVYPEEATLIFLDDAYGITRRWINSWFDEIAVPARFDIGGRTNYRTRIFRNNQAAANKDITIKLLGPDMLPLYPSLKMKGVKPKSVSEIQIGHDQNDDILKLEVIVALDEVELPLIF